MELENSSSAANDQGQRQSIARLLGFLTASEVALLAGIKESTLEAWRKRKKGPSYVWFGREPLYSVEDVRMFLQREKRDVPPETFGKYM